MEGQTTADLNVHGEEGQQTEGVQQNEDGDGGSSDFNRENLEEFRSLYNCIKKMVDELWKKRW